MNSASLPRTRLSPSPSPGLQPEVSPADVVKKEGSPPSTFLSSSRPGISRSNSNHDATASNNTNNNTPVVDHKSPTPPASNPEPAAESDSEAETIVLSGPRARARRNGPDEASGRSSKRKSNGTSRSQDHEDAYSSDLSSAPSSPPPASKSAAHTRGHRRTVSQPARLLSPHRQRSSKSERLEESGRSSRKRKAGQTNGFHRDNDRSPNSQLRVKSSPPVSPPLQHAPASNNATNHRGHTRTRSVQTLGSPTKQSPRLVKSRKGQPASLYLQRDLSPDEASTSSSRSSSPGNTKHRRRPSLNGIAGSPHRAISGGHRSKRDNAGRTLFSKQCQKGHLPGARKLLELEPEVLTEADNAGYLPIHAAALHGHIDVMKFLIKAGSPIDQPAKDLSTPLLDAVENHHIEVIKLLLEAGADPRKRNKEGQTVIDVAADSKQDCDPEEEDVVTEIETALQAAVAKLRSKRPADDDHPVIGVTAESSSSRGASVTSPVHMSPPPSNALQNSSSSSRRRTGRSEPTRQDLLWLDSGKGGLQKLRDSSKTGDIEMVGKLLESGNTPDDEAVILAAKGGHIDVLNVLLAYGGAGDPDPKEAIRRAKERGSSLNPGEETPLLATIGRGGSVEVLKLLIRTEGMNPRRLDPRGRSYAELAKARQGDNWEEEVKILQKAWDDFTPPKSKKSLTEKSRDKSPTPTIKIRRNSLSRKTPSTSTPNESVKRQRRLSTSAAPSSIAGDSVVMSDRESTPGPAKKLKSSKSHEKEIKREREKKAADSDFSVVSDSNTANEMGKKKRRLISGKDLANASASTKNILKTAKPVPTISSASAVEDDDTDMADVSVKTKRHSTGSTDSNVSNVISNRKKNFLDPKSATMKRHRDSSVSSAGRAEKMSDTDATSSHKKRRKLEQLDRKDQSSIVHEKRRDESRSSVDCERVKNKESKKLHREKTEESVSGEQCGRKRESDSLTEPRKKKRDSSSGEKKDLQERDTKLKTKDKIEVKKELSAKSVLRQKQESGETTAKPASLKKVGTVDKERSKAEVNSEGSGDTPAKKIKSPSMETVVPVNEKERMKVLLREQRVIQERGLVAGSKERDNFDKIKAAKDREREIPENAEKEAERERLEEQRREDEISRNARRQSEQVETEERLRREKEIAEQAELQRVEKARLDEQQKREDEVRRKQNEELERSRIQSLPYVFREAATTDDVTLSEKKLLENSRRFLPLYVADLDRRENSPPQGVESTTVEMWISSVQAILLLGCAHDLDMKNYARLEKKPVKSEEQCVLRNILQDMYCPDESTFDEDFDMNNAWVQKDDEGSKFAALKDLFWIKLSDFESIIHSSEKYKHLHHEKSLPLVKVSFQSPGELSPKSCPWLDISVQQRSTSIRC